MLPKKKETSSVFDRWNKISFASRKFRKGKGGGSTRPA